MIRVTVELISARTGVTSEIGCMYLSNEGNSTDPKRGNYVVQVCRRGSRRDIQRRGRVENFPRKSYSIWRLVVRALLSAFPEEKIKP